MSPEMTRTAREHAAGESVHVSTIGRYDNWDARECAIDNAGTWRQRAQSFTNKGWSGQLVEIPRVLHQIWIGDREPPCVWMDSWRLDFVGAHKGWEHRLWDNEAVADFRERVGLDNEEFYAHEEMWQCKADLLRLEILYTFGGVYVDADMVSLGNRSIEGCLQSARETGFGVSFEADTKDKPFSVLGNSIIFAAKKHPLLRLLIDYIAVIFAAKRPYHGVEWVTGPLAFTKALLHSEMPITVIDRNLFYPTFHFVPNPSAIDLSHFPDSLGFQYGYTCSGLGDWIRNNNRCRRALECSHHSKKTDYPLGAIAPLPKRGSGSRKGDIPQVIHQFKFSISEPTRWTQSWSRDFCDDHPGWVYKVWNFEALQARAPFYFSNIYPGARCAMDDETLALLAFEILCEEGGWIVPLSTLYVRSSVSPSVAAAPFPPSSLLPHDGLIVMGSIIGSVAGGKAVLDALWAYFDTGKCKTHLLDALETPSSPASTVLDMQVSDSITSYTAFADGSRFLGAEKVFLWSESNIDQHTVAQVLLFAYDCQAPFQASVGSSLDALRETEESFVMFSPAIALYPQVMDAIPGFIHNAKEADPNWDYVLISLQWETGEDAEVLTRVASTQRGDGPQNLGVIVNAGRASALPQNVSCLDEIVDAVLELHHTKNVYLGTVRHAHVKEVSVIFAAMPVIAQVFMKIAGHEIPSFERDETETHGNLLKGLRGGQLAFEISVDDERRIMYRAFNDDGGMNCECKIKQGLNGRHVVDHARVFFDSAIIYEGSNVAI